MKEINDELKMKKEKGYKKGRKKERSKEISKAGSKKRKLPKSQNPFCLILFFG